MNKVAKISVLVKRSISLLLVACALSLASCGLSPRKQVEILEQKVPEAKQFVDDNDEFLQTLINIQEKLCKFNAQPPKDTPQPLFIKNCWIFIEENQVVFDIGTTPTQEEVALIAEEERVLIETTMLGLSCDSAYVVIYADEIYFAYVNLENATLNLVNPAIEIEDEESSYSTSMIVVTKFVNDDWSIRIFSSTSGVFP